MYATPTDAAATARTESAGSTESGTTTDALGRPGALAVTVKDVAGGALPCVMAAEAGPLPASGFSRASSARAAAEPVARMLGRTIARTRPWYVDLVAACDGSWHAGSPLWLAQKKPGPAEMAKVTLSEPAWTVAPAASTTVQRMRATSCGRACGERGRETAVED